MTSAFGSDTICEHVKEKGRIGMMSLAPSVFATSFSWWGPATILSLWEPALAGFFSPREAG